MTTLEAIMKQQKEFDRLMPKNSTSIDAILKQQQHIYNLIPKNFIDISSKLTWLEKINSIKHFVPDNSQFLNINKFTLDNDLLKITKNLNWISDFQKFSKPFPEYDNFLKIGQSYEFIERDFADLYKEFDDTDTEGIIETPTSIIITETQRVKEIIREIYWNNLKIFTVHPREFEKIIAELLYNQGFEVELTKQTRDNGYDILALKYIDNFSPIKYLVECKRYKEKNKVGVEIIRSFKEVIATEQANKGIIVTSSYFTLDAIKKQKETPYLLDYKNKEEVINWVNEYTNKKTNR